MTEPIGGRMVWHDLMTSDVEAALAFYARLFGWGCRFIDNGRATPYVVIRSGEGDVGGVMPLGARPDASSHWRTYVGVDDLDVALGLVRAGGGRTCEEGAAHPIGGRTAVVLDPQGAAVSLIEPVGLPAGRGGAAMTGHFCWHELLTSNPDAAAAFYASVFGWAHASWDTGEGAYWLFRRGDRDVAGMLSPGDGGGARWLPYVQVMSTEDTAEMVEESGGTVLLPPGDVPGRGRFAVVRDPTGAEFAIFALTVAA